MKEEILKREDLPSGLRWFLSNNDVSKELLQLMYEGNYSICFTAIFGFLNKRLDQHILKIEETFAKKVEPFPSDEPPQEIPF